MIPQRLRGTARLLLLGAICSLLALNLHLYRTDVDIDALEVDQISSQSDQDISEPEAAIPIDQSDWEFPQTPSRPLFSPTRREFVTEMKPEPKPEGADTIKSVSSPPVDRISILFKGTRIIGTRTDALLKIEGIGELKWYPVGSKVGNWEVKAIDPEELTLSREKETISIDLYDANGLETNAEITLGTLEER